MTQHAGYPGDELRRQRESLGYCLNDVCAETHIPIVYIEALETGGLESLPSVGYCAGFLRTYCQFLGLPSERFVDSFRAYARKVRRASSMSGRQRRRRFPGYEDLVTWAAVSAFLLLAWFTYTVVVRPQARDENRVDARTREMVVPPATADSPR